MILHDLQRVSTPVLRVSHEAGLPECGRGEQLVEELNAVARRAQRSGRAAHQAKLSTRFRERPQYKVRIFLLLESAVPEPFRSKGRRLKHPVAASEGKGAVRVNAREAERVDIGSARLKVFGRAFSRWRMQAAQRTVDSLRKREERVKFHVKVSIRRRRPCTDLMRPQIKRALAR